MILYNVTINIDRHIHDHWLNWIITEHIPEVMATGFFIDSKICRIKAEERGGLAYSIQYLAPNKAAYEQYQREYAPALQAKHTQKFNGKFAAFRTLLEVVHHIKS